MVSHYKDLREEYKNMKKENELEREELKREERMAKSFKFTKMSKKVPFLPSLHQKGELQAGITSVDKSVPYKDDREKTALIMPDRARERTKKFNLVSTSKIGYIDKPVGQEFDTYDEVMKHWMKKNERGIPRPVKDGMGGSMKVAATTIPGTNGVWTPNNFSLKEISPTKPLLRLMRTITERPLQFPPDFSKKQEITNMCTLLILGKTSTWK